MKKLFLILSLVFSGLSLSDSYEFFEVDMQELLKSIREKSDNKMDIYELNVEFELFNRELDKGAIPLIKKIYAKAIESKYHLQSSDNMPNLLQLISLCSKNVLNRVVKLEDKSLKKNNLVTYTSILNCNAIINFTKFELNNFIYDNEGFMNENKFFHEIRSFYFKTNELTKIVSRESLFFLAYLQLDTNTYPEPLQ